MVLLLAAPPESDELILIKALMASVGNSWGCFLCRSAGEGGRAVMPGGPSSSSSACPGQPCPLEGEILLSPTSQDSEDSINFQRFQRFHQLLHWNPTLVLPRLLVVLLTLAPPPSHSCPQLLQLSLPASHLDISALAMLNSSARSKQAASPLSLVSAQHLLLPGTHSSLPLPALLPASS